jgi:tRNA (guanine37-N1)-methyltransferase
MKIEVITIFPSLIEAVASIGMLRLAKEQHLVEITAYNLRDYASDPRQVDDQPYGGGPGMIMKPEPFYTILKDLLGEPFILPKGTRTILTTPQGQKVNQPIIEDLSNSSHLLFICGRYEGVDERVRYLVSDELSVGDFILSGGELAALSIIDAVVRLVSGVLGGSDSLREESFTNLRLEYPQYTRPANFLGIEVPSVLLTGNHRAIKEWRKQQTQIRTALRRPDLCQ